MHEDSIKIDVHSGHLFRTYAKIDLDAIRKNVMAMQSNLREGTQIMAVIKTDGYGHGAREIAEEIQDLVCGYAVATVEEALSLREHGVKEDKILLLLGYVHESLLELVVKNHISIDVYTYKTAKMLSDIGKRLGIKARVHFKLDTGMSRLGVQADEEALALLKHIYALSNITVEGIFTHFSASDEADKTKANKQLSAYTEFVRKAEQEGIIIPVKHCANSAGIIDIPEADFNMVRAGIALYGLYPSDEVSKETVPLYPALELKSHVVLVKDVGAGTGISYGSAYVTTQKERIATIPVGYGDGYPRALSNRGYILIHGKRVPIRGRICMDQFMVDVSDVPDAKEGDEVTLIGNDGKEQITVEEICALAGNTFHYELICNLGKRIPRVFFRNQKAVSSRSYQQTL